MSGSAEGWLAMGGFCDSVGRFRAKPAPPTNITEILEATLKKIRVEELRKKLTVITKNRIRIIA
jgi:hypothetical protein